MYIVQYTETKLQLNSPIVNGIDDVRKKESYIIGTFDSYEKGIEYIKNYHNNKERPFNIDYKDEIFELKEHKNGLKEVKSLKTYEEVDGGEEYHITEELRLFEPRKIKGCNPFDDIYDLFN